MPDVAAGIVVLAIGLLGFAAMALAALVRASRALDEVARLRQRLDAALADLAAAPGRRVGRAATAETPSQEAGAPPVAARSPPAARQPGLALGEPPVAPSGTPAGAPVAAGAFSPAISATTPSERSGASSGAGRVAGGGAHSLEARLGGRWLLYLGTGALVVAAGYFVKLAIDNQWITEWMQVALGVLAGASLVAAGHRFVRAGYAVYGQGLTGCGLALLYVSIYAALSLYALVGQSAAFALMVAVPASPPHPRPPRTSRCAGPPRTRGARQRRPTRRAGSEATPRAGPLLAASFFYQRYRVESTCAR